MRKLLVTRITKEFFEVVAQDNERDAEAVKRLQADPDTYRKWPKNRDGVEVTWDWQDA